ncbi:GNAT family protein [Kitasatospora sp. NPDC088351]
MTEDGRIRDHVFVHGAWRDSITYSILEHEWTPIGGLGPTSAARQASWPA